MLVLWCVCVRESGAVMANEEQLAKLRASIAEQNGCATWNQWRRDHPNVPIDLSSAHLTGANLFGVDLARADCLGANLIRADLIGAILMGAHLTGADLTGAVLNAANLDGAHLTGAVMTPSQLDATHSHEGATLPPGLPYRRAD